MEHAANEVTGNLGYKLVWVVTSSDKHSDSGPGTGWTTLTQGLAQAGPPSLTPLPAAIPSSLSVQAHSLQSLPGRVQEVCRARGGGSSGRPRAGEPFRKSGCFWKQREDPWLICFKAVINPHSQGAAAGCIPTSHLPTARELQLAKHLPLHCLLVTCRTQTDNQTGSNQKA